MVGSYQTITYNRPAVQSATKFKAKIVDVPFCDPESGFAILIASRIEDGKSIRLKGKGNPGFNGGEAGDLLLKVNIQPKPGYERNGMDVYTTTEIPFTTAVFGGEAKVSTLYGDVICRIPEGAQTGRKIRLKGKGIVSMKNPSVHGDQYVTIRIQVPQNLSPEAKEKLREFQQVCRNDERKRRGSVA